MDVVRSDVVALGGRIETQPQPGQGTDFKLVLPLTTAVTQVVMVRAGGLTLGVPSNLVELVRRVRGDELAQAYASTACRSAAKRCLSTGRARCCSRRRAAAKRRAAPCRW